MVERLCSVGGMEDPADRGPEAIQWVRASDYDALAARLAEAEAENARLVAANKARDEFLRGHRYKRSEMDGYIDLCESQMDALKARLAEAERRLKAVDDVLGDYGRYGGNEAGIIVRIAKIVGAPTNTVTVNESRGEPK